MDENMSVIHIIGSLHWERTQVESHIMVLSKISPYLSFLMEEAIIVSHYLYIPQIKTD